MVVEAWRAGRAQANVRLGHGESLEEALRRVGWEVLRPLEAVSLSGAVVVRLLAQPCLPQDSHPVTPRRDRDVAWQPGTTVPRLQRVGAYALVRSNRGFLATRHSDRTNRPGTWGLPGGGLETGEDPSAAVVRECWEETGQRVEVGDLELVQTAHWIGRAPSGRVEDFHAVRLVYQATCARPSAPQVLDPEGTTAAAAWIPWESAARVRWATPTREQLTRLGLLSPP